MILKFDHISFSCTKENAKSTSVVAGCKPEFQELSLRNLDCKQTFFKDAHPDHDIYMYAGAQTIPIEVTAYDTCHLGRDSMTVEKERIILYSPEPERTAQFLMLFGLREVRRSEGEFVLEGRFVLGGVVVGVRKADAVEWRLDKEGWSSLGFLAGDARKELDRIRAAGCDVTDVEELEVNQRLLRIGFCVGPFGEIMEVISIKKE